MSGVTTIHAPLVRDIRGSLIAREFGDSIPFVPRRSFIVIDVPSAEIRGEHAHRECHQFITCVQGAVSLVAENGISREEFRLDGPTVGIHVPPMIWCSQFGHSSDAILLVYASHHYDPGDYIRDYQRILASRPLPILNVTMKPSPTRQPAAKRWDSRCHRTRRGASASRTLRPIHGQSESM